MKPRNSETLPAVVFLSVVAIAGLGWMAAVFHFAKLQDDSVQYYLGTFAFEVSKAAFVGASVGAFIKLMLDRYGQMSRSKAEIGSIAGVSRTRTDVKDAMLAEVRDPRNKSITIAGISLRDFLTGAGKLAEVWGAIQERLISEQKRLPAADRLRVKFLMLDPHSWEGVFRLQVERQTLAGGGLALDVQAALDALTNFALRLKGPVNAALSQQGISSDSSRGEIALGHPNIQARLYCHGSFSFVFLSDSTALIEQYTYRDHTLPPSMPILRYDAPSPAYYELGKSVATIWEAANPARFDPYQIGVARAMNSAKIKNVYRSLDRQALTQRQVDCIRIIQPSDVIRIQAMTGRFYLQSPMMDHIEQALKLPATGGKVQVRMIIADPVSNQAILRAVADKSPHEEVKQALINWCWTDHKNSELYAHVQDAIRIANSLQSEGLEFKLRLTSAPLSAAFLIVRGSVFVEQYLYGRSRSLESAARLGGEHPVFEYACSDGDPGVEPTVEERILTSGFNVMWKSFSIDCAEYLRSNKQREEALFAKHHGELLEYLRNQTEAPALSNETTYNPAAVATTAG
jgi:hypothetical protein